MTMFKAIVNKVCPVALALLAGAASAQTVIPTYNAIGVDELTRVIASQAQAQITPDLLDPANPVLKVQLSSGINYSVFMDDCDGGQPNLCKSLEFRTQLPPGAMNFYQINGFNETLRYATAYLTDKGVPQLRMDVSVRGGITADSVAYSVRIFMKVAASFVQQAK
jgi:hypothetical protein